ALVQSHHVVSASDRRPRDATSSTRMKPPGLWYFALRSNRRVHNDLVHGRRTNPVPQLRKILLASDLSARSDRALDRASMIARRHGAELFVVHVLEPTAEMLEAQSVRF